jgi:hypothetical protein
LQGRPPRRHPRGCVRRCPYLSTVFTDGGRAAGAQESGDTSSPTLVYMDAARHPSRCSLCGRLHRPLPGRGSAGLETCPCSESGRWLCRNVPTSEWCRCEHGRSTRSWRTGELEEFAVGWTR